MIFSVLSKYDYILAENNGLKEKKFEIFQIILKRHIGRP
jgi:hypothetical protein